MKIILASHGDLARGMKNTLEMIVGPQDNVLAFSAYGEENVDFVSAIKSEVQADQPAILITDIFGGSVNNAMLELAINNPQITLITGMNLPLVLALATGADNLSIDDIREIVKDSQNNIILVNDKLAQINEEVDE